MTTPVPDRRSPSRRDLLRTLAVGGAIAVGARPAQALGTSSTRSVALSRWRGAELAAGTHVGTLPKGSGLVMAAVKGRSTYADPWGATRTYDYAEWYSPWVTPGFGFGELVPSWSVFTPDGTWVQVLVEVVSTQTRSSGWLNLGRWCATDPGLGGAIQRTSVPGQVSAVASVDTDTVRAAAGVSLRNWRVRLQLFRPVGSTLTPLVFSTGAMVSALPPGAPPVSAASGAAGTVLPVAGLSQELHRGHYPQWDNGGEAWCSATTVAMLVQYWRAGPRASDIAWVRPPTDGHVDYAARMVYDGAYEGCGNWPFTTAYPARWGLDGFVTRLRDLREAEVLVRAGIPLGVSVTFTAAELPGAGYSTAGHLMVLCGFTATGDVVVNDPASHLVPDDQRVRVTYPRAQFERAWLGGSQGTTYVVRPTTVPLPAPPAQANWPRT